MKRSPSYFAYKKVNKAKTTTAPTIDANDTEMAQVYDKLLKVQKENKKASKTNNKQFADISMDNDEFTMKDDYEALYRELTMAHPAESSKKLKKQANKVNASYNTNYGFKKTNKVKAMGEVAKLVQDENAPVNKQLRRNLKETPSNKGVNITPKEANDESDETAKINDQYEELYRELTSMYPLKSPEINLTNLSALKTPLYTPFLNKTNQSSLFKNTSNKKVTFSGKELGPCTSSFKSTSKKRRSSDKFKPHRLINTSTSGKHKLNLAKPPSHDKVCAKKLFSPGIAILTSNEEESMVKENDSEDNKENNSNLFIIPDDEEERNDSSEEFQQLENACASPMTPTKIKNESNYSNVMFATLKDFIIQQNSETHDKIIQFVNATIQENNEKIFNKFAELQGKYMQPSVSIKSPLLPSNKKKSNLRVATLKKAIAKGVPDTPRTNKKMHQAIDLYNTIRQDLDSPKKDKSLLGTPLATKTPRTALSIKLQKQCLSLID